MPSDAVIGNDIPSLRNLPLALVSGCSSARRTRNSDRKEKEKANMFTNWQAILTLILYLDDISQICRRL